MPQQPGSRGQARAPLAFFVLLAGLVLLAAHLAAADAGAKKPGKAKLNVQIKTPSQAKLLDDGRLTVRVSSTKRTRVRITAARGPQRGLFEQAKIRFRAKNPRPRTVKLPLTEEGEELMSRCGGKRVRVTARYRKGQKRATATDRRSLRRDPERCAFRPVPLENPKRCDFLDPRVCLQPFPNDYFTRNAPGSETGKRLDLKLESMPENTAGVHVDQTDMNRADGFSPGNMIIVKVPGLDTPEAFENSGLVPISDLRAYDDPRQTVMVINAETGERHPIWTEIDANPTAVDPSESGPGGINENPGNTGPVNLIIRPAENFDPGARYIVALRKLRDGADERIPTPIGFRVYRDEMITDQVQVEKRRPHMESIISTLTDEAGVRRRSLYMAWDFTVASQESLTDRALTIRDDAFERLGDSNLANRTIEGDAPDFDVTNQTQNPSSNLRREVEGTIEVPCYLDQIGCPPGSRFEFEDDRITWDPDNTADVPFECIIPNSVETEEPGEVTPGVPGTYGHGLLGSRGQVGGQETLANQSNTVWCAVDWAGFSSADLGTVVSALRDMSNFPKMVDRMQQGFVNFMYLSRAMTHPDGLATDPAFQIDPGSGPESVIDTSAGADGRALFMGISQGGIMGGSLMALEPNVDRGVLGVPGMNYSTLLRRSVDSDEYFKLPGLGLYANYPSELERPLLLSLVQLLWDRGEANGYAHNITTDPLPNTPPHEVLMRVALGDHQVANVTAEVEARTIGASVYSPALEPGRHWEQDPFMGIPEVSSFPFTGGSMMVYYDGGPVGFEGTRDGGSGTPPDENVPPRPEWGFGDDPHSYPRHSTDGLDHAESFYLGDGIGACADPDGYCFSNGYTGSP